MKNLKILFTPYLSRGGRGRCLSAGLIISFLIIFSSHLLKAQVTADFSVNISSGCSPIVVEFTDQSTGSIVSWCWDLGNGVTSTYQNTQALYIAPGTYNVTLTVYDNTDCTGNSDSYSLAITVFKNPAAGFSTSSGNTGCSPLTVDFLDVSVEGDANITQWLWDFGDGNTSTQQEPSNTYYTAETYTVSLNVIDANGCESTYFITDYVRVSDPPVPVFSAGQTYFCNLPFVAQFTNSSTGTGNLSYYWDFGDGNTSNAFEPSNTYDSLDVYDVTLIVTDEYGCSATLTKPGFIQYTNVVASFTHDEDTICVGEVLPLDNTSFGGISYHWDFGDGDTANTINQNHSYTAPGTYVVSLQVSAGNCVDYVEYTIVVEEVIANFSSSPDYSCEVPDTVQYTDLSVNAVSWEWHFGDGDTSYLQNPTNIFDSPGVYTDTLIVTSPHGCTDELIVNNNVNIILPVADFTADTLKGCIPLTVNFYDNSIYSSPVDSLISWFWDFDDGNTSTDINPTNTFVNDTTYNVVLTITTSLGCEAVDSMVIEAGVKPVAGFIIEPDSSCSYDPIQFTDQSIDSNLVDEWFWDFGDGSTSTMQDPEHQYTDTTGIFDIFLVVGYNGCYSDTLDSTVYILGPIATSNYFIDCDSPFVYNFISDVTQGTHFYWDFDGDTIYDDSLIFAGQDSRIDTITYTYDSTGVYDVLLIVYNDSTGCEYEVNSTVTVADLKADFIIVDDDTIPCWNDSVTFDASSSQDAVNYEWYYSIDSSAYTSFGTGDSIFYVFGAAGDCNVRLIVTDINGCQDTIAQFLRLYQPDVSFTSDTTAGCIPFTVNFTDASSGDTTLISWYWDFGDSNSSTEQDPFHIYDTTGVMNITLTVTDTLGCIGTRTEYGYITSPKPIPGFYVSDTTICLGDVVNFINTSVAPVGSLEYLWDFGDSGTSTDVSPLHTYTDTGYFSVSLIANDMIIGCDSSFTRNNYIHIQAYPVIDFTADTNKSACYPDMFSFYDQTISDNIASWQWNFGDGTFSAQQDPAHTYYLPGTYDVGLTVNTTYGCSSDTIKLGYIEVGGPFANGIFPDNICKGVEVDFIIYDTLNIYEFTWDFGDGSVIVGTDDTVGHIYNQSGTIYAVLMLNSSPTEPCIKFAFDSINITELSANFFPSDSIEECIPYALYFNDSTVSDGALISWEWDFGDGTTSTEQNPQYIITSLSTDVKLIVVDEYGCSDDTIKSILLICGAVVELPNTFSPNGDGTNDVVYVRGRGIKNLLEFKVFNRWGQLIFETDDINVGWDGNFNGEPQNMDTYVYMVRVEDYDGNILPKSGYISLIR